MSSYIYERSLLYICISHSCDGHTIHVNNNASIYMYIDVDVGILL